MDRKGRAFAALFAAVVAATSAATPALANDGPDAVVVTNREGLAAIAADADSLSGTYVLDADIDLSGDDWTPIGDESTPFSGTFRGNGHEIRNMVCTNCPPESTCRGFFGVVSNATIEGVSVSGMVAGCKKVGGLA